MRRTIKKIWNAESCITDTGRRTTDALELSRNFYQSCITDHDTGRRTTDALELSRNFNQSCITDHTGRRTTGTDALELSRE